MHTNPWFDEHAHAPVAPPRAPWLRAVRAVAEVVFTTAAGPPPAARLDWLCAEVDDFFEHAGLQARLTFQAGLAAVVGVSPLLVGRPPGFVGLSTARRAQALERFERSPIGVALFAVKAMLCIIYYEHPDAARAIDFDGSCLKTSTGTDDEPGGDR